MSLQVETLEQSFEKVKPHADDFVNRFYENLFTQSPEAKPLFAHTNMAKQKKMLLSSLVFVVENLRNPEAFTETLKGLGSRHIKYGALPEHYPLVGNALLTTFGDFLKSDWTPEVKQAWVDAYGAITDLMLEGADYSPTEVQLPPDGIPTPENSVELLENSFAKVKPQASEFAQQFYNNLFTMYPEAKQLFASTNLKEQQKKLLASLVFVVDNLRKPSALEGALKGLGARHVQYGALPEHYPLVGNALLTTFEQFLQSDWTPEVKQAWVNAYGDITEIMLSGADYSEEVVKLEGASTNPNSPSQQMAPIPHESSASSINWPLFGGVFTGVGVLAILLLLL
jgi:hemoglobin-like flavoprotein